MPENQSHAGRGVHSAGGQLLAQYYTHVNCTNFEFKGNLHIFKIFGYRLLLAVRCNFERRGQFKTPPLFFAIQQVT